MFQIDLSPAPYSDPWNIQLSKRVAMLISGIKRVVYFYDKPNNSTFRYRAYNMAQVLNEDKKNTISASYFFLDDLDIVDNLADLADVLVVCRSLYSHRINHLITQFHIRNKRVLFDIDDLVFDIRYAHLIMTTLDCDLKEQSSWDYWYAYLARLGESLCLCDGAITTNDYLANKITEFSGLPVNVVPNFINKEQLNISETLFYNKKASKFVRDDKICLGYFSGSLSHNLDYKIITSALEEVLDNNPNVEIMLVGYINSGALLSRFKNKIKYVDFHDYVNLQRLISSVEFNLMPLQFNDFTNCKSELKYFEAAIVGTLSIASPTYTYSGAIRDGENGYIAQAHQWASVIQLAIDNISTYQTMASSAYADALSKYNWKNQYQKIVQAIGFE